MVESKRLRLIGEAITPVIVPKPKFYLQGCQVTICREPQENTRGYLPFPRSGHTGKLVKGVRKAPTVKKWFQGFIVVDFPGTNTQAKKKLNWFLSLEGFGAQQTDGMGKILWLESKEIVPVKKQPKQPKLKIRKGLGDHPKIVEQAITALLLHDFVHTEKHPSKIYQEVEIKNKLIRETCKLHHTNGGAISNNWLIPIIKKYDGLASFLSRKIPRAEERRYDYLNGEIDCKAVAEQITEKQTAVKALYAYIYYDKTFARFYETLAFADNKLRNHLLLAVNLLINDFKKGKLKVENNKIVQVSTPTSEIKEETKKFLSGSMVLKCTDSSKKGAE
ncbi:MAG: hypothetical protein ACFFDW_02185 [Candidatus Thorarchaeota archaeon]